MKIIYFIIIVVNMYIFTSCVGNSVKKSNINSSPKKKIIIKSNKLINKLDIIMDLENINLDYEIVNGEFIKERVKFSQKEYKKINQFGKNRLEGKIEFINLKNTSTKYPRLKLYLNPITSYSKDWYINSYLNNKKMTKIDKRLFNYLKFTYSKEDGKFKFFGLAKGKYYLVIKIDVLNYNKLIVKEISITQYNNYIDVLIED